MLSEFIDQGDDAIPADRRVKPALLTLLQDQAELIDSSWRDDDRSDDIRVGFGNRRSLLEWYQRAVVRTFGHIANDWPPTNCVDDEPLLSVLLRDPPGKIETASRETALKHRALVESSILLPACNQAYQSLRPYANEYINTADEQTDRSAADSDLDPSRQHNIAMRPGFQTLDNQQHQAIQALWGGFDSYESLMDWVHALNSPTRGHIPSAIAGEIVSDDIAMDYLVYDPHTSRARVYREVFAATVILPAFVDGVRDVNTAELARASSDTPHTMRMK